MRINYYLLENYPNKQTINDQYPNGNSIKSRENFIKRYYQF